MYALGFAAAVVSPHDRNHLDHLAANRIRPGPGVHARDRSSRLVRQRAQSPRAIDDEIVRRFASNELGVLRAREWCMYNPGLGSMATARDLWLCKTEREGNLVGG